MYEHGEINLGGLGQPLQHVSYIGIEANAPPRKGRGAKSLATVKADINSPIVVQCHLPKGIFYDDRCITADSQLEVENIRPFIFLQKCGVGG